MGRVTHLETAVQKLQSSLLKLDLRFKSHKVKCKLNRVQLEERIKKLQTRHKCKCKCALSTDIEFTPERESERGWVSNSESVDFRCDKDLAKKRSQDNRSSSQNRYIEEETEKVKKTKTSRTKRMKQNPNIVPGPPETEPDRDHDFVTAANLTEPSKTTKRKSKKKKPVSISSSENVNNSSAAKLHITTDNHKSKDISLEVISEPAATEQSASLSDLHTSTAKSYANFDYMKLILDINGKIEGQQWDKRKRTLSERGDDDAMKTPRSKRGASKLRCSEPSEEEKSSDGTNASKSESSRSKHPVAHIVPDPVPSTSPTTNSGNTERRNCGTSLPRAISLKQVWETLRKPNILIKPLDVSTSKSSVAVTSQADAIHVPTAVTYTVTVPPRSKRGISRARSFHNLYDTVTESEESTNYWSESSKSETPVAVDAESDTIASRVISKSPRSRRSTSMMRSLKTQQLEYCTDSQNSTDVDTSKPEAQIDTTPANAGLPSTFPTAPTVSPKSHRSRRSTSKGRSLKSQVECRADSQNSTDVDASKSEAQIDITPGDAGIMSSIPLASTISGNSSRSRRSTSKGRSLKTQLEYCPDSQNSTNVDASKSEAQIEVDDASVPTKKSSRSRRSASKGRSLKTQVEYFTGSHNSTIVDASKSEAQVEVAADDAGVPTKCTIPVAPTATKSSRCRRSTSKGRTLKTQVEYCTDPTDVDVSKSQAQIDVNPADVGVPNSIPVAPTVSEFLKPSKVSIIFSESKPVKSKTRTVVDIRKPTWLVEHQNRNTVKPKTISESSHKTPKTISSVSACLLFHAGARTSPA